MAPLEEEEEKRGEAKSESGSTNPDRRGGRTTPNHPPKLIRAFSLAGLPAHTVLHRAAPIDPFRNGLGSPFRC